MTHRYPGWRAVRGDTYRLDLVDVGKRMLGHLENQKQLSGNDSAYLTREMPDGSVVHARWDGNLPSITIRSNEQAQGKDDVEVVFLYVSSDKGLYVIDVDAKRVFKRVTGVENYALQDISEDGKVVFMAENRVARQYSNVRIDLSTMSAFGYAYQVKYEDPDNAGVLLNGYAYTQDRGASKLSPDGQRLVTHFGATGTTGGVVVEGVGGLLFLDAATLAPVRSPLRMTFEPVPMAWAPDSSVFYAATTATDDVGDAPLDARLQALTESVTDYVTKFDADGNVLASQAVFSWSFTPDSGFVRAPHAIAVSKDRVYVVAQSFGTHTLTALNADDMSIVGSVSLPIVGSTLSTAVLDAGTLYLVGDGRIVAVDTADDALSVIYDVQAAEYQTDAQSRSDTIGPMRVAPKSRLRPGVKPRKFLHNIDPSNGVNTVRAYDSFELDGDGQPHAVYTLDLHDIDDLGAAFHTAIRLANVGVRTNRKAA